MKATIILVSLLLALISFSARAQLQTLITSTVNTNSSVITVSSNSYAIIKSDSDDGANLLINLQGTSFTLQEDFETTIGLIFSGPATIQLQGDIYDPHFATIDVEPGPFPPGKTLTIGGFSGSVQVNLQTSTDLINWTNAVNGQTYTNSPGARFFRIQETLNPGS